MYRSRVMLCWRINSNHFERRVSDIQELMLSAGWDYNDIVLPNFLFLSGNDCLAGSMGEDEDLVNGVDLVILT